MLFALFYLLPAAAVLLAWWVIWRIVRLFDLSLVETLEYIRSFEFSGENLSVTIEFDFDELLDALDL
jgi:hypothetical protein